MWLTFTETGVWLAVTIVSLLGSVLHFTSPVAEWLTLPSAFPLFVTRPWTLLTYMAVQFDVFHLLFNVLWLYWFGRLLLLTLPEKSLALYFFGGGIAGGIFFLAASGAGVGGGWLCGCSAAVISVMAGAAIRLPDHPVGLFLIGEVKLKWVAIACCILTFIGGGGNQAAHFGGLVWGTGMALMLRAGHDPARWLCIPGKGSDGRESDRRRSAKKMVDILRERQQDSERLDALLDKIRLSGYGSLSRREREELQELSQKIKRP